MDSLFDGDGVAVANAEEDEEGEGDAANTGAMVTALKVPQQSVLVPQHHSFEVKIG